MKYDLIGLNKGIDCSSTAIVSSRSLDFRIYLRERLSRRKRDGDPYLLTLQRLLQDGNIVRNPSFAETGFYFDPLDFERKIQSDFPYLDYLKSVGLMGASRLTNDQVAYVTHHRAHARAATWVSPFKKALVVVVDGIGSRCEDFDTQSPEYHLIPKTKESHLFESASVYLQDDVELKCVKKEFQLFNKDNGRIRSVSLGNIFEMVAHLIFNNHNDAGKVMGLAAYGQPIKVSSNDHLYRYVRGLVPKVGFKGHEKLKWEKSKNLVLYRNLAATVQSHFEASLYKYLVSLKKQFPKYQNLILTGGCALNCVFNAKLSSRGLFNQIYIPAFPGDESVGLGAALEHLVRTGTPTWRPQKSDHQVAFFGPKRKPISLSQVKKKFFDFKVHSLKSHQKLLVDSLVGGEVIPIFMGSSECGPRALGHRSLLANPFKRGIKDYLNSHIKFRESFRPFGIICLREHTSKYFKFKQDQASPFMDFAPQMREKFIKQFAEVVHPDGTCRIQTLARNQNPWLYEVIRGFGEITGAPCILNTSLNVMGEPLVESVEDLRRFLDNTPVQKVVLDDWLLIREIDF